jgi:hypothetical protein
VKSPFSTNLVRVQKLGSRRYLLLRAIEMILSRGNGVTDVCNHIDRVFGFSTSRRAADMAA